MNGVCEGLITDFIIVLIKCDTFKHSV